MVKTRHESIYIGTEGRILRPLPLLPGAVDSSKDWQRLLAVAEWSAEDKAETISVYALSIRSDGANTAPSDCSILRRFASKGTTTAMQVADLGSDGALVLIGTDRGTLARLQLRSRHAIAESADDVEWKLADGNLGDADSLQPWLSCHSGEVSSIDFSKGSQQAVSVGRDGAIHLLRPLHDSQAEPVRKSRSTVSYAAVKWASPTTFVTAGTTGGLEVWDCRQLKESPVSRSPLGWGHTGCKQLDDSQGWRRQIACLCVHPSRPHFCATGSSRASVALWDLRFQAQPVQISASHAATGDVTEVHFDTWASEAGSAHPALLFSTDDGGLFASRPQPAAGNCPPSSPVAATALLKASLAAIPSFAQDPADGRDIYGLGGLESLLYMHRAE